MTGSVAEVALKRTFFLLILFALVVPHSSYARTWLVRQDGSGDCTTIQACVSSANWYDTVLVGAGNYQEHLQVWKGITLVSEDGPIATTVNGVTCCDPVMTVDESTIDGFTIRGANGVIMNICAGVWLRSGTLRNCVIVKCRTAAIDSPSAAGAVAADGDCVIEQNTIVANGYWALGGGIYCSPTFTGRIEHNIIALNTGGYGVYCEFPAFPTLICNDVWGNSDGNYGGGWCGDPTGTNGNISVDPLLCDLQNGDYRIRCDSACLNAPGCGQIGALGAGCGPTAVTETTWGRVKALFR